MNYVGFRVHGQTSIDKARNHKNSVIKKIGLVGVCFAVTGHFSPATVVQLCEPKGK